MPPSPPSLGTDIIEHLDLFGLILEYVGLHNSVLVMVSRQWAKMIMNPKVYERLLKSPNGPLLSNCFRRAAFKQLRQRDVPPPNVNRQGLPVMIRASLIHDQSTIKEYCHTLKVMYHQENVLKTQEPEVIDSPNTFESPSRDHHAFACIRQTLKLNELGVDFLSGGIDPDTKIGRFHFWSSNPSRMAHDKIDEFESKSRYESKSCAFARASHDDDKRIQDRSVTRCVSSVVVEKAECFDLCSHALAVGTSDQQVKVWNWKKTIPDSSMSDPITLCHSRQSSASSSSSSLSSSLTSALPSFLTRAPASQKNHPHHPSHASISSICIDQYQMNYRVAAAISSSTHAVTIWDVNSQKISVNLSNDAVFSTHLTKNKSMRHRSRPTLEKQDQDHIGSCFPHLMHSRSRRQDDNDDDAAAEFKEEWVTHDQPVAISKLLVFGHKLMVGMNSGLIRIFDLRSGKCSHRLGGHDSRVSHFATRGGVMWSGSEDGSVRWWGGAKRMFKSGLCSGSVSALEMNEFAVVAGYDTQGMMAWDLRTQETLASFSCADYGGIRHLSFDSTKLVTISSTSGRAALWRWHKSSPVHLFPAPVDHEYTCSELTPKALILGTNSNQGRIYRL